MMKNRLKALVQCMRTAQRHQTDLIANLGTNLVEHPRRQDLLLVSLSISAAKMMTIASKDLNT